MKFSHQQNQIAMTPLKTPINNNTNKREYQKLHALNRTSKCLDPNIHMPKKKDLKALAKTPQLI
jgi:hypothetical protein